MFLYSFFAGAIVGITGGVVWKITRKPVKKVWTITVPDDLDK